MAKFAQCPQQGHIKAALRVCEYLKAYAKARINVETDHPIPLVESVMHKWTEFCEDLTEQILSGMPGPKGKEGSTTVFVDADDAPY